VGIPVMKEPAGLFQSGGKRPDDCTLIPCRGGRSLAWDVTVSSTDSTVAASYLIAASYTADAVADQAADRKCSKYTELSSSHEFQPVAVESHGPLSDITVSFLGELGRKITNRSGNPLCPVFLSDS